MFMENKVELVLTPEDKKALENAVATINNVFDGRLIALTGDEKMRLAKMSDKSIPFVSKVLEYFVTEPKFAPPYVNMESVKRDYEATTALLNLRRQLNKIMSTIEDTAILSGSEAYVAALAYYNSVKRAAQKNVPGAKVVYEDLNKRFKS
jgi:hypothetical protein